MTVVGGEILRKEYQKVINKQEKKPVNVQGFDEVN